MVYTLFGLLDFAIYYISSLNLTSAIDKLVAERDELSRDINDLEEEKKAILHAISAIHRKFLVHDEKISLKQAELKACNKATAVLQESYTQVTDNFYANACGGVKYAKNWYS